MNILESVLTAIRGRRQQHFSATVASYDGLVLAVAAGEEADVDSIAVALDELDRSDTDFTSDVEAKMRRLAAFSNLKKLQKVASKIPALSDEVTKLDAEITAFLVAKRPALAEAAEELRTAEREAERIDGEKQVLRTVGVSLALQNRQAALALMVEELRPIRERYNELTSAERKRLPFAEAKLEEAKRELGVYTPAQSDPTSAQREVDDCERQVSQLRYAINNGENLRIEIEKKQAAVDLERREIEAELMKP